MKDFFAGLLECLLLLGLVAFLGFLLLGSCARANDAHPRARAAVAVALALRQAAPPAPAPVKVCDCSPECTCGCQSGQPCTCPRGGATPNRSESIRIQAPFEVYRIAPVVPLHVPQSYPAPVLSAPVNYPARSSAGC